MKPRRNRSPAQRKRDQQAADGASARAFLLVRLGLQVDALQRQVAALAQVPSPEWLSTAQAAQALHCDRAILDSIAPRAAARCPDVVAQVGQGKSRRTYRWLSTRLGEALKAGQEPDPDPETSRPRRRRRRPSRS